MNVFDRAGHGFWLSPFERAALRLLEGIGISALVAGLTAILPYLSGTAIDWPKVLQVFLATALSALLLAILKYAKAFGDGPLQEYPPAPASGAASSADD